VIETGLGLPQGCGDVTDVIGVSAIGKMCNVRSRSILIKEGPAERSSSSRSGSPSCLTIYIRERDNASSMRSRDIIQVMGRLKLRPEAALRLYSIAIRVTIHLSLCAVVTLASPNRQRLMDVITHARPLTIGTYPSDTAIHPDQARLIPHYTPRPVRALGHGLTQWLQGLMGVGEMTLPELSGPACSPPK
jgi:hypothetical protein